jgi:hypothetical protein
VPESGGSKACAPSLPPVATGGEVKCSCDAVVGVCWCVVGMMDWVCAVCVTVGVSIALPLLLVLRFAACAGCVTATFKAESSVPPPPPSRSLPPSPAPLPLPLPEARLLRAAEESCGMASVALVLDEVASMDAGNTAGAPYRGFSEVAWWYRTLQHRVKGKGKVMSAIHLSVRGLEVCLHQ